MNSPELSLPLKQELQKLKPVRFFPFTLKLIGIHAVATLLTLSICPQFGVEGLKPWIDLSDVFMRFGHTACQAMCGMIYFSLSMLVASLVIRKEELFYLKRYRLLFSSVLISLSLGFFVMNTPWELEASFVTAWIFGGLAGSLLVLKRTFHKDLLPS